MTLWLFVFFIWFFLGWCLIYSLIASATRTIALTVGGEHWSGHMTSWRNSKHLLAPWEPIRFDKLPEWTYWPDHSLQPGSQSYLPRHRKSEPHLDFSFQEWLIFKSKPSSETSSSVPPLSSESFLLTQLWVSDRPSTKFVPKRRSIFIQLVLQEKNDGRRNAWGSSTCHQPLFLESLVETILTTPWK